MSEKSEAERLADLLEMGSLWPDREAAARELRRLSKVEAQRDALLGLIKEARKIVRASSSRNFGKDWDQRTTAAIKSVEEGK